MEVRFRVQLRNLPTTKHFFVGSFLKLDMENVRTLPTSRFG